MLEFQEFQQKIRASIQNLENQLGQLTTSMSILESQELDAVNEIIFMHTLEEDVEEEAVDSSSQLNFEPPMEYYDNVPKVLVTDPHFR